MNAMNEGRVKKRSYRSKVRRVTACVECHRRKQKCDRETPCNICVDRGIPAQCKYYTDTSSNVHQSPIPTDNNINTPRSPLIFDQSQLSALSTGIGYSDSHQNGAGAAPNSTVISGIRSSNFQQPPSIRLTLESRNMVTNLLKRLPEPPTTRKLVGIFFSEANWYFTVLDRCFFDQRYRTWLQCLNTMELQSLEGEKFYFAGLLFQVLAMALHFVPRAIRQDPDIVALMDISFDHTSQLFSESGDTILTILGRRRPDLSSIEADILRCAWLKNSGHGYEAWYSLGQAVRQAQDIGLHLEPVNSIHERDSPNHLQAAWQCEHKRRIWACLFTWGSHMALQLGRPRMINITDCTAQRPTDCDAPTHLSRTLVASDIHATDVPSQYTSHIVKYDIALKIDRALTLGLLQPNGQARYDDVLSLDTEVTQMLDSLPIAFRHPGCDTSWDLIYPIIVKQRLQIRIVADAFLLTLHRPHISAKPQSLHAAVTAAKNVLHVSEQLFLAAEEHQYKTFTLVFYTIDAGIFLAITMTRFNLDHDYGSSDSNISRSSIIEALDQSVNRLQCLEKYNTAAKAGRVVIKSCLDQIIASQQSTVPTQLVTPPSSKPTPAPVLAPGPVPNDPGDPYLSLTDTSSSNDEFLLNLLNDSASMFSWLENYIDYGTQDWEAIDNTTNLP